MSKVLIYHYPSETAEPIEHEAYNALAWQYCLAKLIDKSRNLLTTEPDTVFKPAYNQFQRSNAPKWKKVATGFLSLYTLVLDEDRKEIANALRRAYVAFGNEEIAPTVKNVADKILQLEKGPIVVTTSGEADDSFPYETRINLESFKSALDQFRRNPTRNELEALLEEHQSNVAVPVARVLQMFDRGVNVPRYWD